MNYGRTWPPGSGVDAIAAAPSEVAGTLVSQGPSRPHVCFVSMSIYPILAGSTEIEIAGGAEVQQAILARALNADGFKVSVLTADHGQPDIVDSGGVQIHSVSAPGHRGLKGLRFIHPLMTDVLSRLRRIDPDIVYFRVAGFRAAAAAWYARTSGKRFVYACASDREFDSRAASGLTRRDGLLFRWAVRSADAVLAQNMLQERLLSSNFGRTAVVIPNCYVEPHAGRAAPNGPIIWVGTFKPVKRPDLFLELARQHPSKTFVMVGGADIRNDPGKAYFGQIREEAARIPNLDFVGFVPFSDVGRCFDNASVLVNTSDREGFPNTFLQAWIRAVPTLSFVRPEVTPGRIGTIVCSDLDDMSSRLRALTTRAELWQAASVACEAHFNGIHSVDVVIPRYRELFQHLNQRRA